MPFRSKYRPFTDDCKQPASLTGLSYRSGRTSMSAPCLVSQAIDVGDEHKGNVCDSDLVGKSPVAASKEVSKSPPSYLTKLIKGGRSKQYSMNPMPTVPEGTLVDKVVTSRQRPEVVQSTPVTTLEESDVATGTVDNVKGSLFLYYADGDEGGVTVRTRMEAKGMECLDYHRDGCYGQPENAQLGKFMDEAKWIVLYMSDIHCERFNFVQQMAIQIAEDSTSKKIVNLISSLGVQIPPELKLFPVITVEDEQWLSQLQDTVRHDPETFSRQKCSLKKCPLSGSSQSIQSDCFDVVRRLNELGKSGVSPLSRKYVRHKQIWEDK